MSMIKLILKRNGSNWRLGWKINKKNLFWGTVKTESEGVGILKQVRFETGNKYPIVKIKDKL